MYQAVTKEMLPQMGQQKALCTQPAILSNRLGWEESETKDLKEWALQSDFKEMGNCKLNCNSSQRGMWSQNPRAKTPTQMRS